MKRATLKDVACRAGVHAATASRALNESSRHLVQADTLDRVLRAAAELGYTANIAARTLRTATSRAVGILVPDITNPIFPPMVRGAEEVLRSEGYSTWVVNTDDDSARNEEAVSAFRQRNVDGIILATARLHDPALDAALEQGSNTPYVFANRRPARSGVPSVRADEAEGARMVLDHLVALGHRRIVLVAGPQDVSTGRAGKQAFVTYVRKHGLPVLGGQVTECGAFTFEAGREAMRDRLREDTSFTAVVAGNDLMALGCLDSLAEAGLRCPEDVSVVGFNDMMLMDRITPALTTVAIPYREIGVEAARLLVAAMSCAPRRKSSVVLKPVLQVRESSAPPPKKASRQKR
ncbi:LacI family DNA-binding transcriptional regulator [Lentzea cavernae]|uniref:LacI family DNA-binding transcriptional regulator n=1 Tax=Lentzea cavernae TaxID=2020703 RepID=UPI00174A9B0A|nr:LacI family DNA-binding transcriptional regulator [Lentzea cavernae]